MKFSPPFSLRKHGKLTRQEEKIFAEASELALLRLEQCIADLHIWVRTRNNTLAPHWLPLRGVDMDAASRRPIGEAKS